MPRIGRMAPTRSAPHAAARDAAPSRARGHPPGLPVGHYRTAAIKPQHADDPVHPGGVGTRESQRAIAERALHNVEDDGQQDAAAGAVEQPDVDQGDAEGGGRPTGRVAPPSPAAGATARRWGEDEAGRAASAELQLRQRPAAKPGLLPNGPSSGLTNRSAANIPTLPRRCSPAPEPGHPRGVTFASGGDGQHGERRANGHHPPQPSQPANGSSGHRAPGSPPVPSVMPMMINAANSGPHGEERRRRDIKCVEGPLPTTRSTKGQREEGRRGGAGGSRRSWLRWLSPSVGGVAQRLVGEAGRNRGSGGRPGWPMNLGGLTLCGRDKLGRQLDVEAECTPMARSSASETKQGIGWGPSPMDRGVHLRDRPRPRARRQRERGRPKTRDLRVAGSSTTTRRSGRSPAEC